ncbi:MAG TPA: HTH domain-containing protein [Syntrophorhabdaceae bacterium]|nr:HTH domain-containing protein [Syntrophorhabdaceae bacterium]
MAYSYLDLASDVLKAAKQPLIYQEIWELAKTSGLSAKIKTSGKTPWQTLGAQLYVDVRDNSESKFIKVGKRPARFFLKERQSEISANIVSQIEKEEQKKATTTPKYRERDLHPVLAYFAYSNPSFNRGRSIYTKTILHEKSLKQGYNEWVHPDMVGFYLPIDDWRPEVIEFNRILDNNSIRLFSFEIKKFLNKANYRESYFQAVSNSSWAHEGYLVAAEVLQDDDFLAELERLAASFGLGIIHLDLADIDSSSVLYPARIRGALDWETINKLCDQNPDFEKFVEDVKIDFESKRIHKAEYDDIVKEPAQYIMEKFKIEQVIPANGL